MTRRQPYVKPIIMQLHYSTEEGVSLTQACKGVGGNGGVEPSTCKTTNPFVNCQPIGS